MGDTVLQIKPRSRAFIRVFGALPQKNGEGRKGTDLNLSISAEVFTIYLVRVDGEDTIAYPVKSVYIQLPDLKKNADKIKDNPVYNKLKEEKKIHVYMRKSDKGVVPVYALEVEETEEGITRGASYYKKIFGEFPKYVTFAYITDKADKDKVSLHISAQRILTLGEAIFLLEVKERVQEILLEETEIKLLFNPKYGNYTYFLKHDGFLFREAYNKRAYYSVQVRLTNTQTDKGIAKAKVQLSMRESNENGTRHSPYISLNEAGLLVDLLYRPYPNDGVRFYRDHSKGNWEGETGVKQYFWHVDYWKKYYKILIKEGKGKAFMWGEIPIKDLINDLVDAFAYAYIIQSLWWNDESDTEKKVAQMETEVEEEIVNEVPDAPDDIPDELYDEAFGEVPEEPYDNDVLDLP